MDLWAARKRFPWRRWVLPVMAALIMAYTFDQLWNGERGLVTWRLMHNQVTELHAKNSQLKADVAMLESNTNRLKGTKEHPMDEDFLDEQIRKVLPLTKKGDMVVVQ